MSWGVFGSILGTAANFWQQNQARKDAKSQFAATTLTARVNEARRLGLSPLAVLGSPTSSPTIQAGGQSNLGSHLKDLVTEIGKTQQQPKQPKLKNRDPLAVRAQLAEVRRLEAEAAIAEKRASDVALATSPGRPLAPPGIKPVPLTVPAKTRGGKVIDIPNPEILEDEVTGNLKGLQLAWERLQKRSQKASAAERKRILKAMQDIKHKIKRLTRQNPYSTGGGF